MTIVTIKTIGHCFLILYLCSSSGNGIRHQGSPVAAAVSQVPQSIGHLARPGGVAQAIGTIGSDIQNNVFGADAKPRLPIHPLRLPEALPDLPVRLPKGAAKAVVEIVGDATVGFPKIRGLLTLHQIVSFFLGYITADFSQCSEKWTRFDNW